MSTFAPLLISNKFLKYLNNMDWINDLLWGEGIGHSILLLSIVIAAGIQLGRIKVFGVSLGITLVLFVGIILGHFGFTINSNVIHFFKEFGLILFVYSVGMQVGPGFFSSFKKGGVTLNMLACGIVFLGVITAIVIHYITGVSMSTMVGILSGAVTNTPGLGAAQQAYSDMFGVSDKTIALGYAVAYPLGVIGIILSTIFIRYVFRISFEKETEKLNTEDDKHINEAKPISLIVKNPALFGKKVSELSNLLEHRDFVISRVWRNDNKQIEIASAATVLQEYDKIFVITTEQDAETIKAFIGEEIDMERKQWIRMESQFINRRILITKPELNGKHLGQLKLRKLYGINITRINRAGVDLVATPGLRLQVGDRVNVVGTETAVSNVEKVLGNSMKRLNEPNLITIFIGIALGIILGSIPISFPGIPQPVKLGLAGGPLVVAILISRFGYQYKLITYTTQSANFMLREIGITLFLACVGLSAGDGFVDTIVNNGGLAWIGYGFIITVVPLLIVGCIGRYFCKINYFTLMGLIAGSTTDPPALAYSNATAGNDAPSVGYATVYPLTMFLRVLTAQLLILFFA
ncbi:putative transport protein [Parabacteroides chinchillae]|uniref:Putative transport protein n=2 Tax=Parabacteroides chinchillae TaxID=871327 RepID=A0A8G2BTM2_9BACT|nr:putative transport protein [Parabacteroides chinchillae]